MCTFINNKNVICDSHVVSRPQYSTFHSLINITENVRKASDDGNIGCGVFVDLQIAFDTVDEQILLVKLNNYWIRGVCNDLFKFHLSNGDQYVSKNGYKYGFAAINCGVPE